MTRQGIEYSLSISRLYRLVLHNCKTFYLKKLSSQYFIKARLIAHKRYVFNDILNVALNMIMKKNYICSTVSNALTMKTTETQTMVIKFDGDNHQIDANTLISILTHYNSIISIANQEFGNGNRDVKLTVNAIKPASFDLILSLCEGLKTIFSSETLDYLSDLTTIAIGLFTIYKLKKGNPIKTEEDKALIKNNLKGSDNVVNNTFIIYNQPVVREAISKSFERANEDSNVDGMTISKNNDSVSFSKSDFPSLIYKDFDKEDLPKDRALFDDNAYLTIIALSFTSGGNWKFIYNGFKISMSVKDDALMKVIDCGTRFGKGDTLRVKLKINQRYDDAINVWENVSYRIEEFYEHIPAPIQGKLFEE